MRTFVQVIPIVGLVSVIPSVALAQRGPAPDARLIEWLRSPIPAERAGAVTHILRETSASTRSPAVEQALVEELTRVNKEFARRWQLSRAGQPLEGDFPAEYHFELIEAVSQSSNPIIIPALAGALGTGRKAQEGLAKFEEQAVAHILPVAQQSPNPNDEPPAYVVTDAVSALAILFDRSAASLSEASRNAILEVARERLSGVQDAGVISAACALAIATKDPTLRQRVQQLANNRAQLVAMGVSKEASIRLIQTVASRELRKK